MTTAMNAMMMRETTCSKLLIGGELVPLLLQRLDVEHCYRPFGARRSRTISQIGITITAPSRK